jgi:PilZ domain
VAHETTEADAPDIKKIAPRRFAELNMEWWLLGGLLLIAGLLNYFAVFNQMLLGLYTLPTLFSAYLFGRRHAILTAFASVFTAIVVLVLRGFLSTGENFNLQTGGRWYEIIVWGGILVVTAYAMGTLFREVREVYRTLHLVLQYQMKNGVYVENSVFRTTEFARTIAESMKLSSSQIEDLRHAATLIDISNHIDTEILNKTARIALHSSIDEKSKSIPDGNFEDPLPRVAQILEACGDGTSRNGIHSVDPHIRQTAGVLRLASEYAEMTSDSASRKGLSPVVARNLITRSALAKTEPALVDAFLDAFEHGYMESIPIVLIHKLRRYSRVPMVIPVEIATELRSFKARTEMLGGGGVCLVTPERLQVSQSVRVSFDLPRLGNMMMRATVCWTRAEDDRAGLEFEPGAEQKSVDQWISNLFRDLLSQSTSRNGAFKAPASAK